MHIGVAGAPFAERHRARRLDLEHVRAASLILTASKAERSAIARLDPAARSRTFTLREAAALATVSSERPEADAGRGPLERFAAGANAARGLVRPVPAAGARRAPRWFSRGETADPLDLPDGHTRSRSEQVATIAELPGLVERIVAGLVAVSERPVRD